MAYYQHCAYPEFIVRYSMPVEPEIEWPERKNSLLVKVDEVKSFEAY